MPPSPRDGRAARKRARARDPIPSFASYDGERAFWDTVDLSDYWDTFEPIEAGPAANVRHLITFEIDIETLSGLVTLGRQRGVEPLTLAAQWLAERVKLERQR